MRRVRDNFQRGSHLDVEAVGALIVTDLGLDTELAAQLLKLVQECSGVERCHVLHGTPGSIIPH